MEDEARPIHQLPRYELAWQAPTRAEAKALAKELASAFGHAPGKKAPGGKSAPRVKPLIGASALACVEDSPVRVSLSGSDDFDRKFSPRPPTSPPRVYVASLPANGSLFVLGEQKCGRFGR